MADQKTKEDKRTRYTKMFVRDALADLVNEKDFSQITVRELCDRAEVNRSTFYLHYGCTQDVLDELFEEYAAQLSSICQDTPPDTTMEEFFTSLYKLVYDSKIARAINLAHLSHDYCNRLAIITGAFFESRFSDVVEEGQARAYAREFITRGISAIGATWAEGGFKEAPEELAHLTYTLVQGGFNKRAS